MQINTIKTIQRECEVLKRKSSLIKNLHDKEYFRFLQQIKAQSSNNIEALSYIYEQKISL